MDKLPLVEKVIVIDELPEHKEKEISWSEVLRMGKEYLASHSLEDFLAVGQSLQNGDYATITYTSGTTADPKGVILTHRNYTANVEQALSCVDIDDTWRTLVILPLDHCFAHVVGFYIFMSKGASVATVQVGRTGLETLKNIPANIKEFKPYLILSVPALAKNFKKNIEQGIRAQGKHITRLFNFALKVAYIYNGDGGEDKGRGARFLLKPLVSLFDRVLFTKVRENFGGQLKFFIGGGALLDKDLQKFYYAIGLPMYQGYGLSEATPVISTNGPHRHTFGSSGVLVRPLDLKICDADGKELPAGEKGEIVIRGENVMAGYWKNPVSTAETVRNGWLYTGDTVALVVPNKDGLKKHLAHQHLDLSSDKGREEAIRIIQSQIDRFRKGGDLSALFPDRWLPAAFAILPEPFTEQNGMVNSTMKIVRGKVEKAYASRIDHLYTPEGKNPLNEENKKALD